MSGPYRESDNAPLAPLRELEWRRRVLRAARWALVLIFGEMALLVATWLLPARFAVAGAAAYWVMGAGIFVAIWKQTARRPGAGIGWRSWLLRGSVLGGLAVVGLRRLGLGSEPATLVCPLLVVVVSVVWGKPFVRPPRLSRGYWATQTLSLVFLFLMHPLLDRLHPPQPLLLGLLVLFCMAVAPSAVRRVLLAYRYAWWLDTEARPPGEWLLVLAYRDQQAELLRVDGTPGWFRSEAGATAWLEENAYVPAERAIRERLVNQAPPDLRGVVAWRARVAAATSPEPRVPVASDVFDGDVDEAADAAIDELDEHAFPDSVDEAVPRRLVATDQAHDPRD